MDAGLEGLVHFDQAQVPHPIKNMLQRLTLGFEVSGPGSRFQGSQRLKSFSTSSKIWLEVWGLGICFKVEGSGLSDSALGFVGFGFGFRVRGGPSQPRTASASRLRVKRFGLGVHVQGFEFQNPFLPCQESGPSIMI